MALRRIFSRWLFPAAVVLPLWVLVGWSLFSRSGWSFVGLLALLPVLLIGLAAVAGITAARPSVREFRAVSWADMGVYALWQATIVGFGFFGATSPIFAVLGVITGIIAFWWSITRLVRDARRRVAETFEAYERVARGESPMPPADGGVYVVEESHPTTRSA